MASSNNNPINPDKQDKTIDKQKRHNLNYYLTDEELHWLVKEENWIQLIKEYSLLRDKYVRAKQRLKDRVDIDRAKDYIRDKMSCNSKDSFMYIQQLAQNHNISLGDSARRIIEIYEAEETLFRKDSKNKK